MDQVLPAFFEACGYCSSLRCSARDLISIDEFTQKKVRVFATNFAGTRVVASSIDVVCDHCGSTGKVPTKEGKALLELVEWSERRHNAAEDGSVAPEQL